MNAIDSAYSAWKIETGSALESVDMSAEMEGERRGQLTDPCAGT